MGEVTVNGKPLQQILRKAHPSQYGGRSASGRSKVTAASKDEFVVYKRTEHSERIKRGLDMARSKGVKLGRKRSVGGFQLEMARKMSQAGYSYRMMSAFLHIPRSTLHRYLHAL